MQRAENYADTVEAVEAVEDIEDIELATDRALYALAAGRVRDDPAG